MSQDSQIREWLEQVARHLVSQPEGVSVRVVDGRRATRFEILAPEGERGQLIGREGVTIRSLRSAIEVLAVKQKRRFEVEIPG
ncbi:MAG: KH domain-containing protein [Acidobacteriota bacterium]